MTVIATEAYSRLRRREGLKSAGEWGTKAGERRGDLHARKPPASSRETAVSPLLWVQQTERVQSAVRESTTKSGEHTDIL